MLYFGVMALIFSQILAIGKVERLICLIGECLRLTGHPIHIKFRVFFVLLSFCK
jgi:hypothetical protein